MVSRPKQPSFAVLDGDILCYRAAYWADQEGTEDLGSRLEFDLQQWTPPNVDTIAVAFSCSRKDNFRSKIYPLYKEHRTQEPPRNLKYTKDLLSDMTFCYMYDDVEADDLLGRKAEEAVMVTIDKDLLQISGWHYHPLRETLQWVSPIKASFNFHRQWLTGDSTDNLPGVPGLGDIRAENTVLYKTDPINYTQAVLATYERKDLSLDYCLQMARCVRILRAGEDAKSGAEWDPWSP